VRSGALRAIDWRLGWDGSLVGYGVELILSLLQTQSDLSGEGLRRRFRDHVLTHFNPRGTHFDGFVARLFDIGGADAHCTVGGYALGLSSATLPVQPHAGGPPGGMRLHSTIYAIERQCAIVQTLYRRYEDYLFRAVERFGERHIDDFMSACTDQFRHDIGYLVMRFRGPAAAHEREWIAIVLASAYRKPGQDADPVRFDILNNRLVPVVALDIAEPGADGRRRPAVEVIAIGVSLPAESTREALKAYLRRHGLPGIAVTAVIAVIAV
jgi:hypothetical protein